MIHNSITFFRFDQESNKLTVQLPGSDQVVTLDMSLASSQAILQAANQVQEVTEGGKDAMSTVGNGTLTQLLTMTQAANEQTNDDRLVVYTLILSKYAKLMSLHLLELKIY